EQTNMYDLIIRIGLTAIEIPVGTVSASEELWSYLNEEAVRQVRSPALGFNGLRMGRGDLKNWPDVAKVLSRMTGRRLQEASIITMPGNPTPITLATGMPVQTIFVYRADRTFEGMDYPPGDNVLNVTCTYDQDDPTTILITAVPQVHSARRRPKFVKAGSDFMMVNRPVIYSIPDATFQVHMPKGSFLVIGPGAESQRPSSVGNKFFVKQREGVEFETVIVLRPDIFATPVTKPKPLPLTPALPTKNN
ncbi:hypothetical protein LCGC14_3130500, partial [marine sediment metagenome]